MTHKHHHDRDETSPRKGEQGRAPEPDNAALGVTLHGPQGELRVASAMVERILKAAETMLPVDDVEAWLRSLPCDGAEPPMPQPTLQPDARTLLQTAMGQDFYRMHYLPGLEDGEA